MVWNLSSTWSSLTSPHYTSLSRGYNGARKLEYKHHIQIDTSAHPFAMPTMKHGHMEFLPAVLPNRPPPKYDLIEKFWLRV